MRDLSASIGPAVAASFDWSLFQDIADIGGGIGSQLPCILDAHPSAVRKLYTHFGQLQTVIAIPMTNS